MTEDDEKNDTEELFERSDNLGPVLLILVVFIVGVTLWLAFH